MKKLHKLSCGVIAILMAMHQVQAESDFDSIKRLRPDTFSDFDKERWLYYGKDHQIFDVAGTQIKLNKVKKKPGNISTTALLLLSPDRIPTPASTGNNKRQLLPVVDSHDLNYSVYRNFADDFKLNAFEDKSKEKLGLDHIVIDGRGIWTLKKKLVKNPDKSTFSSLDVNDGALILTDKSRLHVVDTYIHEKGVLGGGGILHGNVKNCSGLLFVGKSLFFKNWGNDNNNIPKTKTKKYAQNRGWL